MGLSDDILKENVITGLAIGIGAAIIAPVVIPVVSSMVKPLLKSAIKGGFILFEKGKETIAEVSEVIEDIVAEVKAELEEAHKQTTLTTSVGE